MRMLTQLFQRISFGVFQRWRQNTGGRPGSGIGHVAVVQHGDVSVGKRRKFFGNCQTNNAAADNDSVLHAKTNPTSFGSRPSRIEDDRSCRDWVHKPVIHRCCCAPPPRSADVPLGMRRTWGRLLFRDCGSAIQSWRCIFGKHIHKEA